MASDQRALDAFFRPSSVALCVDAGVGQREALRLSGMLSAGGARVTVLDDGGAPFDLASFDLVVTASSALRATSLDGATAVLDLAGACDALDLPTGLLLLGPRSAGVVDLVSGFSALRAGVLSGARPAQQGGVALVTQRRPLGEYCLRRAVVRGVALSKAVSTGGGDGLSAADCVRYLAHDDATRAIALALDEIEDLADLAAALGVAAELGTPVVLYLAGDVPVPRTATLDADELLRSLLVRAAVHRAASVTALLNDVYALARAPRRPDTGRVCLLTGSGGVGVLMADRADAVGLDVAPVPPRGQEQLLALWPLAAVQNPVDTTAQVINNPPLLAEFTRTVLREGEYDAAVIFMTHIGLNKQVTDRRRVPLAEVAKEFPDVLLVVTLLTTDEVQEDFEQDGFLVYEDPFEAVSATRTVVQRGEWETARSRLANTSAGEGFTRLDGLAAPDAVVALLRAAGIRGDDSAAAPSGRPPAELGVTLSRDATYGLAVRLELGVATLGRSADVVCGVGPLSEPQALQLLSSLRGYRNLTGVRGDPPLDVAGLGTALSRLTQGFAAWGAAQQLVISPLLVHAAGSGVQEAGTRWEVTPAQAATPAQ